MRLLPAFVLAVLFLSGCDAATSPEAQEGRYTAEEIDYFVEVALGTEFGGGSAVVRRWERDLRVAVLGSPTDADLQTLADVVTDVNALIGPVELRLVDEDPTVTVHFLAPGEFASVEPNYVPGNLGFFWVNWTGACEIVRSRVLVATEGVTQAERSHLIREELTQSLGLPIDSGRYPASIFYGPWTDVTSFAPIDRTVVEMLYRPEVRPCMGEAAVRRVLSRVPE